MHREKPFSVHNNLPNTSGRGQIARKIDALACAARETLQLGDPFRIRERTGVTVVSDFRSGDTAAGGYAGDTAQLQSRA